MIPLWMFPVATVCGNTMILKPSEKDPGATMLLARLAKEAGLPDGVLQVAFVCMCVCVGKVQSVCVCVVCDEHMRAES
jgi:acyl-CoA reductase-like NAD-dependent aldehyde dehydrogenase